MTPMDAYRNGELNEALQLARQVVKTQPQDIDTRLLLTELCCIAGELEKADLQLQTLLMLSPELALSIGHWRQLVRAADMRQAVYAGATVPALIGEPTEAMRGSLQWLVDTRSEEGQTADTPPPEPCHWQNRQWQVNGQRCQGFRDLDDLAAAVFECLATNGNYFWIDWQQIESLVFHTPQRPLDLLWRKCDLTLLNGTEGVVYMPAIYPDTGVSAGGDTGEQSHLGLTTHWQECRGLIRGLGQKEFLAGDDVIAAMDLQTLQRLEETQ